MRVILIGASVGLCLMSLTGSAATAQGPAIETASQLKPFNVTIRRFDMSKGPESGVDFVLPVDSPDAEHACASTMANASAFSMKVKDGKPLPVAFACTKIEGRP